ncbi:MAG: Gmad2 immunoglobulin-like domain-containing protein [Nocardioidaceae bacterium]
MTSYDDNRDAVAELLSQSLSEEAATVSPTPGSLQSIQQRTARRSAARNPWLLGTLGAGLATAAVITAVVLVGNNGTDPSNATPPAASQPSQSGSPTATAQPTTSPGVPAPHQGVYDPSAPASEQFTMYYVGPNPKDLNLEPRLFTETHSVTSADSADPVAAVHEFLTSTPIDPDYRRYWPEGIDVSDITEGNGVTTIALFGGAQLGTKPDPVPPSQGRETAVQALLWTAGVQGEAAFTYNRKPVDLVLYTTPFARALVNDFRAFITIDNIIEGQTMTNPVTVQVSGNTFEGNVVWSLSRAGAEVDSGYTTTSQGTWTQVGVDLGQLDPGTYTVKAWEPSAENGSPINVDDKTFTVE